jgi:quinoprotein glucose dehydrogenase
MIIINSADQTGVSAMTLRGVLLSLALAAPLVAAANSTTDQLQLGTKYSPLTQVNRENVSDLELAWEYHTGDVPPADTTGSLIAFEDQPSLIAGNLVVCTTSRRLIALDPQTGEERWVYDPKGRTVGMQKCRGVASWEDTSAEASASCRTRIFVGTTDNRLVAIDARSGKPCQDFGEQGAVQIQPTKPEIFPGELLIGSRPTVVNDVVVVGSAVADNQRVDAPSGRVLAFDARTGRQVWEFDPLPRDPADPASSSWDNGSAAGHGGGNVWSDMSADQALDLVYLPTTSVSGDFYGGDRPGDNLYSTSVVALRGATGEVAWHFQFVHHNVFDYDVPTQPMLIDYPHNGKLVPALLQNTKQGLIFVFDRATGEPLVPIEERPVPQEGAVPGEKLSPTQPFPVGMPTLAPQGFSPDDAWGFTFIDKWLCRNRVEELSYGPIYTPVSEKGTIFSPSAGGGPNWGGASYDPQSHVMVVPTNRVPMVLTLISAQDGKASAYPPSESLMAMTFPLAGSPYHYRVEPLLSVLGSPCSAPPWAALTAVDMEKGKILWEVPLGSIDKMLPVSLPWEMDLSFGTPGAGGPLLTAGGLVFIGYTLDDRFRAFDVATGEVVWQADLPAAGTSVPVTYEAGGEQYIVIPAGGHSMYQSTLGDSVMAYKLKSE